MTAAGRAEYAPITTNDSADGRAANRRTRIIILPKLDQFYGMIEEGLKEAE
jgi:chemotaxis protein MotB